MRSKPILNRNLIILVVSSITGFSQVGCNQVDQSAFAPVLSNAVTTASPSPSGTTLPSPPVITAISPGSGPTAGGTLLTIYGTGFIAGNISITIGGALCSFPNFISTTEITCVTGSNTWGSKNISIVDLNGQVATFPPQATPSPSPSPIPSISPSPLPARSFENGFVYVNPAPVLLANTGICLNAPNIQQNAICPTGAVSSTETAVTIAGNNFLQGALVTVGGLVCCESSTTTLIGQPCSNPSPTVTTSTQPNTISCKVPPNALVGPAPIRIVNPDGQSVSSTTDPFTIATMVALNYPKNPVAYLVGTAAISANTPTVQGAPATTYSSTPDIHTATGLTFNASTGVISGTASATAVSTQQYTVTASSAAGIKASTTLTLGIVNFGAGGDGPYVSGAAGEIINSYAAVSNSSLAVGATSMTVANITLGSATFSTANRRILVIQMQNSKATPAGAPSPLPWEYATIQSIAGPVITLASPLQHAYKSGNSNSNAGDVLQTQIVSVPDFTNVTVGSGFSIQARAWNAAQGIGGIVAYRANGTTTVAGSITADSLGFTGGASVTSTSGAATQGVQGESWMGLGSPTAAPSPSGGGGGGGLVSTVGFASGGGGGYGSAGIAGSTDIGTAGMGGVAFGISSLTSLFLGPGGGGAASSSLAACVPSHVPDGAPGGGIVLIETAILIMSAGGTISANGHDALIDNQCYASNMSGGAGAGGTVYIRSIELNPLGANQVTALGGGNPKPNTTGTASAGGVGRIRLDSTLNCADGGCTKPGTTNPTFVSGTP